MEIKSPLNGIFLTLDQVPDPVFSQGLAGQGFAIDPMDLCLTAPMSGKVNFIHPSKHAISLVNENNLEVLVHIGIDTVKLNGEGFECLVKEGDFVKSGQELISFDLNLVGEKAKSLISMVVFPNLTKEQLKFHVQSGEFVNSGQILLDLDMAAKSNSVNNTQENLQKDSSKSPEENNSHQNKIVAKIICTISEGIHARPASRIVQFVRDNKITGAFHFQNKRAMLSSLTEILKLEISADTELNLEIIASDPQSILDNFLQEFKHDFVLYSRLQPSEKKLPKAQQVENPKPHKNIFDFSRRQELNLQIISSGMCTGTILVQSDHEQLKYKLISEESQAVLDHDLEMNRLNKALLLAENEINTLIQKASERLSASDLDIFRAHLDILKDSALLENVSMALNIYSAPLAWLMTIESSVHELTQSHSELIRQRAADIKDVGDRVLKHLLNSKNLDIDLNENSILLGKTLTPSALLEYYEQGVRGICLCEVGKTSHLAILAKSLGIPLLSGLPEEILDLPENILGILDAHNGKFIFSPSTLELTDFELRRRKYEEKQKLFLSKSHLPAKTIDDIEIRVCANVGKPTDHTLAKNFGAESIGLLRTEFLFLGRKSAPKAAEQLKVYREMLAGKPQWNLKIRCLDIGGDKVLEFLHLKPEENPFLGVRGVRLLFQNPEIFNEQLRAIYNLALEFPNQVELMFPMVNDLEDWQKIDSFLQTHKNQNPTAKLKVGVMVEVPACVIMAEQLAPHVDFFSIGSNDLTQYVLAMDRNNQALSQGFDGLNPAVLQMIYVTAAAGNKFKKSVSVCGDLASDLQAVPILIGLGIKELSCSIRQIPAVKDLIRQLKMEECRALATLALHALSAKEVRQLSSQFLENTLSQETNKLVSNDGGRPHEIEN